MENTNQKKSFPLEHLSDEQILQLLNSGSYSANVRWEVIRRKITKGEYDPDQSAQDSLFMLNSLAFYSELNKNNKLTEEAESIIVKELNKTAEFAPDAEAGKEPEKETTFHKDIAEAKKDFSRTALPLPDLTRDEKIEKPSAQSEKPELKSPHSNFNASPFLRWIKSFDSVKSPFLNTVITEDVKKVRYELQEAKEKEEIKSKNKKNKKSKNKKKSNIKSDKIKKDLSLDPEIISETLADLLASQGHFKEADEMYRQLGVKYPKKSSYFASKLKKS